MTTLPDTTLVFATMDRPQAAQRFVFSIRERYPDLAIHVADQTEPSEYMRRFYARHGVEVVWMPHDSGVCVCRNELVRRTTSKYLFLCDDDLIFTPETDLSGVHKILEGDPEVGIVGGRWIDDYDWGKQVRQWALFLHLDPKNRTLTGLPAYCFLPNVRYVGHHKYYLADTALNFALFRRSVFDAPDVRWDPRFQCNGEHEDFYLNFKTASKYRVAYYPGLVCKHRRPHAPKYERFRERSDGWARFLKKWGIDQYYEMDNGTRTLVDPDKVHKGRTWSMYLANIGLSSENEWKWDHYDISFTDDFQLTLASHYDPETGVPVRYRRSSASLYLNEAGELISAGGEAEPVVDEAALRTAAFERLKQARADVTIRFDAPLELAASSEAWLSVSVVNASSRPLAVGQNASWPAKFSCRWRRGASYAAPWDDSTECFVDVPVGVHEQIVRIDAPARPGVYELEILLVVGDALVVGLPSAARIHVTPEGQPSRADAGPVLVESEPVRRLPDTDATTPPAVSGSAATGSAATGSAAERLRWIRDHVRARALLRSESPPTRDALLAVAIECTAAFDGAGASDVPLTAHFKKDGRYLTWDTQRYVLSGVRCGPQIRAIPFERPLDPAVEVEFGALVTGEGYVPLFTA